jgi:hypothetical protein
MIIKCDRCKGTNIVFVRSEPVFDETIGVEPKKLRNLFVCRDCNNEFDKIKKL